MPTRPTLSGGWQRAVGEVLLIVVGVLVALWIEEWRQVRADRATESEYLTRLTLDVDEDITDLENQLAHLRMREENALAVLEFLDSDTAAGDASVIEALNRAGFISFFRHNRATMDDLLSTGNLSLVSDKELVRQVNNYYRSSDFLVEFDDQKKHWIWREYRGSLDRHIPSRLLAELNDGDDRPVDLSAVDWDGLRDDRTVRTGLGRVLGIAAVERRSLQWILERAKSLREAVGSEHSAPSGAS